MIPDGFRIVPWTRNSLFPPQNIPTSHLKKFFQNRFWDLETLFLLIWAWEGLKIHHFRGSQLEFFRLNHASSEHIRWVWNSRRQCLKGLWSTFSIYFVILEKKVFNIFFRSKMTKSFINSLTLKLKKSKNHDFFRFLQIASKC